METLVDTIRTAITTDASPEARAAGIVACRNVLAQLEPAPTQAITPAPALPAGIPPDAIPQLIAMVKQMDMSQLLDVAIERLRAVSATRPGPALPDPPRALAFQLVPIPPALKKAR